MKRLATALRALAEWLAPDPYALGKTVRFWPSGDWGYLRRCSQCGFPRGSVRHYVQVSSGYCGDPDNECPRKAQVSR